MPLPLLPKQNPYSKTRRFLPHTLHYITPIFLHPSPHTMHSAAAAKFNAVLNTQLSLILHLCAHPVLQYTLNATQPSMHQQTVSSRHYRVSTLAHRFLKRTTIYLLNNKTTVLHLHNPLPSSNISCPSCPMQRHLLQQISASQILLTPPPNTASHPS